MTTKRAVVVGVNDYSVQGYNNLRFCVADAAAMYHMLVDAFSFAPQDIYYLTDGAATSTQIRQALRYCVTQSQPGDVICFYYSGHGARTPHPAVPTQMFETIIPFSGQHISDHEIYCLADSLNPSAVNFTIILDSCHSGGMHDESEIARRARSPQFSADLTQRLSQCRTLLPCGICLPPANRSVMDNNIRSVTARHAGVVVEEDSTRRLVQQAKSTLIAASSAAQVAMETEAVGHGLLTKSFLDLVNASNFSVDHNALIDSLTTSVAALMTKHFAGQQQTPQLRGQANRMGENFLEGWRDSR